MQHSAGGQNIPTDATLVVGLSPSKAVAVSPGALLVPSIAPILSSTTSLSLGQSPQLGSATSILQQRLATSSHAVGVGLGNLQQVRSCLSLFSFYVKLFMCL